MLNSGRQLVLCWVNRSYRERGVNKSRECFGLFRALLKQRQESAQDDFVLAVARAGTVGRRDTEATEDVQLLRARPAQLERHAMSPQHVADCLSPRRDARGVELLSDAHA